MAVVNGGAYDLNAKVSDTQLPALGHAFNFALTRVSALSIASAGATLCSSLPIKWISVKERNSLHYSGFEVTLDSVVIRESVRLYNIYLYGISSTFKALDGRRCPEAWISPN